MEQHPVPQQISAYHFRLVGDMTIKQFLELTAGIVIGWIIYSLPFPAIFRWPLVIFSVFSGVAFAFLPLEERPLDRWLIAFVKAIYAPTQFIWRKTPVMPSYFEEVKLTKKPSEEARVTSDRRKLEEYLETLPSQGPETAVDKKEGGFVSNIMRLYGEVQTKTVAPVRPKPALLEEEYAPNVRVAVRKLKSPPLDPRAIMRGEIILPKRRIREVQIPQIKPVEVEKLSPTPPPQAEVIPEPAKTPTYADVVPIGAVKIPSMKQTREATLSPNLPMPTPPQDPNVIAGMVVDSQGNIVDNAIVTIKDADGNVARAQKTNKIGQFFIVTPLLNGEYEIEVEREGLAFDIIKIKLEGKLVQPIEIRSK
ncbi:MAG: hypothetical protein A2785_03675 [Candidatus Chisholmbacteria bacterium RIFCSPHIGHO2_01_FULL_49_18]|uniref:Uncharacterized protein n=2 Tax=Candidatus Chisholmiibacteriota TaxID=1817900 RepID=A0A1G1VNN5_9BACT|nr:MAG: hypothetical protein A2785_03675 [Candidatus Chisholmbacteria bacterium RIFCSPHIGHO2_01_FULL_49_18]OGY19469.1 MAG: hypothetical protein A3A65_06185 [Candidatus Chisholmbacteria bacterium RIFCSPLOWO2_01_FULL_49_14]